MEVHLLDNMKKGFTTLFIVIITGSIALALILLFSGGVITSINIVKNDRYNHNLELLNNSCAEIALEEIRMNNNFIGQGQYILDGNECFYIVSLDGLNKKVEVSGSVSLLEGGIVILIDSFNPIHILSWKEY